MLALQCTRSWNREGDGAISTGDCKDKPLDRYSILFVAEPFPIIWECEKRSGSVAYLLFARSRGLVCVRRWDSLTTCYFLRNGKNFDIGFHIISYYGQSNKQTWMEALKHFHAFFVWQQTRCFRHSSQFVRAHCWWSPRSWSLHENTVVLWCFHPRNPFPVSRNKVKHLCDGHWIWVVPCGTGAKNWRLLLGMVWMILVKRLSECSFFDWFFVSFEAIKQGQSTNASLECVLILVDPETWWVTWEQDECHLGFVWNFRSTQQDSQHNLACIDPVETLRHNASSF